MTLVYIEKLGFQIQKTNIGTKKIDGTTLVIYGIIIANFFLQNKYDKDQFSEKTFLGTNISMRIVLGMPLVFLSNINIKFAEKKLEWRKYTTIKALLIKKKVELVNLKKFAAATLDL